MKKRLMRTAIIWIVVFAGASYYFYTQKQMNDGVIALSPDDNESAAVVIERPSRDSDGLENEDASLEIGGAFSLVDQDGQPVTEQTYADTHKLVFFGFTNCPAVCPTELQKVTLIMDELGDDAEKITPMFITVDPERDSVEQIKGYVVQFHPRLVGLTGTQEQIDGVKNAFKVYASKVENEMMEEYMVDHSAFLYLTDKDNMVLEVYPSTDTAEQIAADIKSRGL